MHALLTSLQEAKHDLLQISPLCFRLNLPNMFLDQGSAIHALNFRLFSMMVSI